MPATTTALDFTAPIREYAATAARPDARRCIARAGIAPGRGLGRRRCRATPPLAGVRTELPNLLAALSSALDDGVPEQAIAPAAAVAPPASNTSIFRPRGSACRGRGRALRRQPAAPARGHALLGAAAVRGRKAEARFAMSRSGSLARRSARSARRAPCTGCRGALAQAAPRRRAPAAARPGASAGRAAADLRAAGQPAGVARVRDRRRAPRPRRGERLHARALAFWERTGNDHAIEAGRYNLVGCAAEFGSRYRRPRGCSNRSAPRASSTTGAG